MHTYVKKYENDQYVSVHKTIKHISTINNKKIKWNNEIYFNVSVCNKPCKLTNN